MAAVLACGGGAVLSHDSAGLLWSISTRRPDLVHVTVPTRAGRRRRNGICVHRSGTLPSEDRTRHRGIPVTSYERTLRDLRLAGPRTRSDLERLFIRICRRHGLPAPLSDVAIGPFTVDFLWPHRRLVVEVDSWVYHRSHASFTSDRARDRDLTARGYTVLRFTDQELEREPAAVAATVLARLGD